MHPLQSLNAQHLPASDIVTAEPLVFAHGYGCDQTMWADVSVRLPDFERWLFDWPGAGRAEPDAYDPSRHAHLEGYADDLLAVIRSISNQAVTVVAHSVAASIAMLAAVREPALFRRLILVTPSPCFLRELPHYDGGFDRLTLLELLDQLAQGVQAWSMAVSPMIMGQPDRPDLEQRLSRSICRQDPTIAVRWARATFLSDVRTAVPRLTMPVDLLQARVDALVPPSVGAWMSRQLPRGRMWPLQASGHCPHVSAPDEVAAAIRSCAGGND
jgi:sigma-B regulation protein RsbQ